MAGSIPCLSRIIGTKVPTNAAIIITPIIDPAIVRLIDKSWLTIWPKIIKITERAKPLIRLSPTYIKSLFSNEPFTKSFAKPWTIIAEDCTPTLPAIAAIKGV